MKLYAMALAASTFAVLIIVASPALGTDVSALQMQDVQGNVAYVSGGIGEDEATMFKRAAAGYPLELQFVRKATPRDEFLADVKVTIRDRSGAVVLDAVSDGPFLLAKMPSGTYRIEAEHYGVVKRQTVDIRAGKHGRAVFAWAAPEDLSGTVMSGFAGESSSR